MTTNTSPPNMTQTSIKTDIAIIGGGIAGLWLLNRLCNEGYNAILLQQGDLGAEQTIASQGMIHGGIKYALGGALTGSSEAIADMPDHWRRCLAGDGDVDLRNAKILSDHFYLWSTQSLVSRVSSFFASKVTRGRVDNVKACDHPAVFDSPQFKGNLYKLVDLVLDVPSVIKTLADNCAGRIFTVDWTKSELIKNSDGSIQKLQLNQQITINAQQFIFTAGEGNEKLLRKIDQTSPPMQRRPLKQVLVKHNYDYPLYAHCMGGNPSPRLTISSHKTSDGKHVWYLGGDLATENINTSDEAIIAKAKLELAELFPWLDFSDSEWATLFINRAEPKQKGLIKPDQAFAEAHTNCSNLIVGWPTKLTLAPNMTNAIFKILEEKNIQPLHNSDLSPLAIIATPAIATPCWETAFNNSTHSGQ
jgi:glycerol-3-phosphate dehydrogenase